MKLFFRVNYETVVGQCLVLKVDLKPDMGPRIRQELPMRWLNQGQWEVEFELHGGGDVDVSYAYQLRQEPDDLKLDEWGPRRLLHLELMEGCDWVQLDDWRSAGLWDSMGEARLFDALRTARCDSGNEAVNKQEAVEMGCVPPGMHVFFLAAKWVPAGCVPCLIGGSGELGGWEQNRVVRMAGDGNGCWSAMVELDGQTEVEYKYGLLSEDGGDFLHLEEGGNRVLRAGRCGDGDRVAIRDVAYHDDVALRFRGAGVALPVFSLRSAKGLGVGEFADLKLLANWVTSFGGALIQILPIHDTSATLDWRDSYPYAAISALSLHPMYLRIEDLRWKMGDGFWMRMKDAGHELNALEELDYEAVMKVKGALTREMFETHVDDIVGSVRFKAFVEKNAFWLNAYAAFCVLRDLYGTADFDLWGDWAIYDDVRVSRMREAGDAMSNAWAYYAWLQMELDAQLADAVAYLRRLGVALKGDLPIGIDRFSADAWANPVLFHMDRQAGAPPDAFAIKGQNWGFPTYNWDAMERDGYRWWCSRLERLSEYFDVYRIDHILGFFRIWQIPMNQVEGIMGWFEPARPIALEEFAQRGIEFDVKRYCQPYLREDGFGSRFGDYESEIRTRYLSQQGWGGGQGRCRLREHVQTQRQVELEIQERIQEFPGEEEKWLTIRQLLMDCVSDVLFIEVPGSEGRFFHPRYGMQQTYSYQELGHEAKWRVEELYLDYFYRRQEGLWQAQGFKKLQVLRGASRMLLCGEDLGMVPRCVSGVLRELGILTLEIQRMPKAAGERFGDLTHAPHMSVVSPSTHDMDTMRGWWEQGGNEIERFSREVLGLPFAERSMSGGVAERVVEQHLESPAMWAIFLMQDLLAMDEALRRADPAKERINVPAVIPYYWRYRMHLTIEELSKSQAYLARLRGMIERSGRSSLGGPEISTTIP